MPWHRSSHCTGEIADVSRSRCCTHYFRDAIIAMVSSGQLTADEATALVQTEVAGTYEAVYLGSVPVAAANLTATMWSMFGAQVIFLRNVLFSCLLQGHFDGWSSHQSHQAKANRRHNRLFACRHPGAALRLLHIVNNTLW